MRREGKGKGKGKGNEKGREKRRKKGREKRGGKNLTLDVVGDVGVSRNKGVQSRNLPRSNIRGMSHRRLVLVGERKVIKEVTKTSKGFNIVVEGQVSNSTLLGVSQSTSKDLSGDIWREKESDLLYIFFHVVIVVAFGIFFF